eukprot:1149945-Pelagomonas_calceolata.AAC.9
MKTFETLRLNNVKAAVAAGASRHRRQPRLLPVLFNIRKRSRNCTLSLFKLLKGTQMLGSTENS